MAYGKRKTEMKGTGGGRWETRAEAKGCSDRARRANDKAAISEGREEDLWRTLNKSAL